MNATYFHLVFTHFPIIGTLIGCGLLLWGMIKRQNNIKSVASAIIFIMALIAIPVYLTGESAEESVENLAGVSESMLELHEGAAKIAMVIMGITGLAGLIAVIINTMKKPVSNIVFMVVFVLSLATFGAMARTGYYGGRIRHTEIAVNTLQQQGHSDKGTAEPDND